MAKDFDMYSAAHHIAAAMLSKKLKQEGLYTAPENVDADDLKLSYKHIEQACDYYLSVYDQTLSALNSRSS